MKEWFTKKEASEYLGMSITTLNRYMKSGKITYYKNSNTKTAKTKFKQEDLSEFMKQTKIN